MGEEQQCWNNLFWFPHASSFSCRMKSWFCREMNHQKTSGHRVDRWSPNCMVPSGVLECASQEMLPMWNSLVYVWWGTLYFAAFGKGAKYCWSRPWFKDETFGLDPPPHCWSRCRPPPPHTIMSPSLPGGAWWQRITWPMRPNLWFTFWRPLFWSFETGVLLCFGGNPLTFQNLRHVLLCTVESQNKVGFEL